MMRKDSVEEFISHVNRNNYPLSSQITPSIFETNSFLISQKNTTLIEYSAYFGSIQIFQYLKVNGVELTPSLWLRVIHSKNPELIHILEDNNVTPPEFENKKRIFVMFYYVNQMSSQRFLRLHPKQFGYFKKKKDSKEEELIVCHCIKYHNYSYFETTSIKDYGFFYLNLYKYDKLFDLLLKEKEINLRTIQTTYILMKNLFLRL